MITKAVETHKERIQKALQVISDACSRFNPSHVFALFSGGHDSLVSSFVASMHPGLTARVHINTGIGIPVTNAFVHQTCGQRGWNLLEYKALENTKADGTPDPQDYDSLVMKHGFPGPFLHRKMYNRLKERQLARLRRDFPGKVLFISGSRQQESRRRMRHTEQFQDRGQEAWCAPIWDWPKQECLDLMVSEKLPVNEAAMKFGRSGECLCGAFAKPGELELLKFACPESYNRIRNLEQRVRASGFPWGWEDAGPPDWWKEKNAGQQFLFEPDPSVEPDEPLCTSCRWRSARHERVPS